MPLPASGISPHSLLISGERHPVVAGGRGQRVRQDRGTDDPGADPHAAERHSPGCIAEQGNAPGRPGRNGHPGNGVEVQVIACSSPSSNRGTLQGNSV